MLPDSAVAGPCADRHLEFEAGPKRARAALACEIARVRERHDLRRLAADGRLRRAARRHVADMVRRRYFAHVTPGGRDAGDRARRTGYARRGCSWRVGEVLAWGVAARSSARATVRAWMRSPSHRRVLLSPRYAQLGVAMRAGTPDPQHSSGTTAAALLGTRRC